MNHFNNCFSLFPAFHN